MQLHTVAIDVESVRAQLSAELTRPVTDIELFIWLRRCGYVQRDGKWVISARSAGVRRWPGLGGAGSGARINAF